MASTVTHRVHPVSNQRKGDLLTHVLKETPGAQALVFCKTKHGSNKVGQYLERAGINAAVIHGNKSQGARTKALGDFKAGRVSVLVATDIAARGLDIAQLPLVVNFDLPLVASDYIHRAGRTGRAGLSGRAVSLVSPEDRNLLRDIQRLLPAPIEHVTIDGFAVTASSHEALPDAGRRHQGRRPGRGFSGSRSGARHGSGGSGRRPSRPGRSAALTHRFQGFQVPGVPRHCSIGVPSSNLEPNRTMPLEPLEPWNLDTLISRSPRETRSGGRNLATRTRGWRHRYRRGR